MGDSSHDQASLPEPSRAEQESCQLASWFPTFSVPVQGRRHGLSFQTRVLDVPQPFVAYLAEDGVRLPPNAKVSSCLGCTPQKAESDDDEGDDWSEASSSSEHKAESAVVHEDLSGFTSQIDSAIRELGGAVIPKLNWSAPKDASWINEGTLKCSTAGDVCLLLKSSEFIASDVELVEVLNAADESKDNIRVQLILRKWANLFPSQEFRCFVKNHRLIGVSQRHADQHFKQLAADKDNLMEVMEDFFEDCILHKFASDDSIPNYVVDVYVDRQERVWIVDFNVWGNRTDSLLFDWAQLRNEWNGTDNRPSEIRIVETEKEVRPHPLNNFRAPTDTVHIASITGGNSDSFQAFMELSKAQAEESSGGED